MWHIKQENITMVNRLAALGDVVLVTGGGGFVGRHLVPLLLERGENIAEVRVLDLKQMPEDFPTDSNRVRYCQGDVRDVAFLRDVCEGVSVVIHMSSVLDTSETADMAFLHDVNVNGTRSILDVCIEKSIETFIYTSSTEINRTFSNRERVSEQDIDDIRATLDQLVIPAYSTTKKMAEEFVLAENDRKLPNGKTLRTLALRPCGIYGEGDKKFVYGVIKTGRQFMGLLPVLGSMHSKIQRVYAGNVAWAHVHTLNLVRKDTPHAKEIAGKAYSITDATPLNNNFVWMKPFLESQKVKVLPFSIPLWLCYAFWALLECIVWLISPIIAITLPASKKELYLACSTCYYDDTRAKTVLGYRPLYPASEAFRRSYMYYSTMPID